MKILSSATDKYLAPVKGSEGCTLSIHHEVKPSGKAVFVCTVFQPSERVVNGTKQVFNRRCNSIQADNFYTRFKHGCHVVSGATLTTWECPANQFSVSLFQTAWKGKREHSPAGLKAVLTISTLDSLFSGGQQKVAEFKDGVLNPYLELVKTYKSLLSGAVLPPKPAKAPDSVLEPYQQVASDNMSILPYYGLYMDPGTGKTATSITALDKIAKRIRKNCNRPAIFLIAVPKSLCANWKAEIAKFSTAKNKVTVLKGGFPAERDVCALQATVSKPSDGYEALYLIGGYDACIGTPMLELFEYDAILIDEAHNIANGSTDRAKFFLKMRDKAARRFILTGTPIRSTPFDLYTQLEFLCQGASGFSSLAAFKEFYGKYDYSRGGAPTLDGFKNIPMLQETIAKYCYVLKKWEALPFLPEKSYDIVTVELTAEQKKSYAAIAYELQAEFDLLDKTDTMSVNNHLTKMLRLAQITSGFANLDSGLEYRFDPSPKEEALIDMLKSKSPDDKTIVWCSFKPNIRRLAARLKLEGIENVTFFGDTNTSDRAAAEREFNTNPNCKVLIGHPACGGVGLNLLGFDPTNPDDYTTNANHIIFYSRNWVSTDYWQAQDRAHRYGTRVPVRITNMIVDNSIDVQIYNRVELKTDIAVTTQDVSSILQAVVSGITML